MDSLFSPPLILKLLLVLLLVLGGMPTGPVVAQGGLDLGALEASYGSVTLAAGFTPDPLTVPLSSGGRVDITAALGAVCRGDAQGYAARTPDFRVELTAASAWFRFFFVGSGDTTLVVHGPDGQWLCDDDTGGRGQPMLTLVGAAPGRYDVWVGSYQIADTISGSLTITSDPTVAPAASYTAESQAVPKASAALVDLDLDLVPVYGTLPLLRGLPEDPLHLPLQTGGPVAMQAWQPQCAGEAIGFTTAAPSLRVYYGPSQTTLLRFLVWAAGDTTLLINAPDGDWYCNDDAGDTLNPAITFEPAQSGWYNIWAGSFDQMAYVSGDLIITTRPQIPEEVPTPTPLPVLPGGPSALPTGGTADPAALDRLGEPSFGEVTLAAGFEPDPHTVRFTSGGAVDLSAALGPICQGEAAGFVARTPDYRLKYTGVGAVNVARLRVFFAGNGDTTLAVSTPDGRWLCDDDTGGALNPLVDVFSPANGTYNIWVGSYERGDIVTGTLTLTELDLLP